ncbi:hypothetical protein DERP_007830 [Dermatophagoides pteronyssinus]|uniref:Uncharacterized protein n=1 Tax=Dermatophagoides pteronyssinus TaxID=6956 RepID=A0ABQ8ISR1_DERPT|nr:hypothetical protein DERP_007830 [Dermatophagoides pteronyssinus]
MPTIDLMKQSINVNNNSTIWNAKKPSIIVNVKVNLPDDKWSNMIHLWHNLFRHNQGEIDLVGLFLFLRTLLKNK